MDFNELSQSRRSIRNFKPRDISQEDLIKLITAAQSAPSAGNCQPWHFYIVNDKAVQTELKIACYNQEFMMTAPVFIVVCADIQRSTGRYGDRGKNLYCIQDTAAAIQNLLLCAKSLGLGTCWCGAFDEAKVSAVMNLNDDMRPIAIIPVGYPVSDPIPTKRRPLNEIMTVIGESKYDGNVKNEEVQRKIEHSDMGDTIFNDVNLGNSKFNNINFYGVNISDANLTDGKIHNCNLSNFEIYDCILDKMTINGKDICELLKD
ncbi:MAG: nitroreductase family protein [Oscillospiraceae bacterium]|nr:nitroreductase family protein [Oscillospiraceae bacterium]